jgi:hypothetical protein
MGGRGALHLALCGAFGFLLLGFDLAGHLVLLSGGGLVRLRVRGRARGRIAYNRASRWPGGVVSEANIIERALLRRTNNSLHLRKLARLLLDTHAGGVVRSSEISVQYR